MAVVSGFAVVVALAAGCGASGPSDPAAAGPPSTATLPPTTPPPTTAAPSDPATDQVRAAYGDYWRVWVEANDPPRPDDPALATVATGDALLRARAALQQRRDGGLVMRLPASTRYSHVVQQVTLDGDSAQVVDCSVDDAVISSEATGIVLDDRVVTRLVGSRLVLDSGSWKVESVTTLESWDGVAGCAL